MTNDGHVSNYLSDVEAFADMAPRPIEAQLLPDGPALAKADYVLKTLLGAGLKSAFGFDREAATTLWAGRLGRFSLAVLEEAIVDWVARPGTDFPSVGDVETNAAFIASEREREASHEARNRAACSECDDVHYVRVLDDPSKPAGGHHMMPCPACPAMRERLAAYDGKHFKVAHIVAGGCPVCWPYLPSQAHRRRAAAHSR